MGILGYQEAIKNRLIALILSVNLLIGELNVRRKKRNAVFCEKNVVIQMQEWTCDKCGKVITGQLCSVETESGELYVFDRKCQLKFLDGDRKVLPA